MEILIKSSLFRSHIVDGSLYVIPSVLKGWIFIINFDLIIIIMIYLSKKKCLEKIEILFRNK